MEEEIDRNTLQLKKPVSQSMSIHQLYEFLGKQIENSSQKKGKDSTTNYQKFYNYCEKVLGTRKNQNFQLQNSKMKDAQLLELYNDSKFSDKQRLKIAQQIRYLQNKIWDLDLVDIITIKTLIPTYNELFEKLKVLDGHQQLQTHFQNIIQEVANDLNQNTR